LTVFGLKIKPDLALSHWI